MSKVAEDLIDQLANVSNGAGAVLQGSYVVLAEPDR